jgi:cytochrome b
MAEQSSVVAVKVWDLPVRIFHWTLVSLLVFQFASGRMGGAFMAWHVAAGYCVMVLLVFRLLWGFAGSTHARFASFVKGPVAALRFAVRLVKRTAAPQLGYNPLGGWMVLALLTSLTLQAVSGLLSNDGLETWGPFARHVTLEVSDRASLLHRWNFKVMLGLAALHLGAALYHWLVLKEDLIGAMFTGVRRVPEAVVHERRETSRDDPARRVASRENARVTFQSTRRALGLLAVAMAIVWLAVAGPLTS